MQSSRDVQTRPVHSHIKNSGYSNSQCKINILTQRSQKLKQISWYQREHLQFP